MEADQEWCLQCGAGVSGSLATQPSSWRSTAAVLGATAILVAAAATAAYAALSKKEGGARHTATVTGVPAPAPVPVTPGATAAIPTPKAPAATTAKPTLPRSIVKPPKIPLRATTPKPAATTAPATTKTPATTTTPTARAPAPASSKPGTAITLDTNAVTTYNPDGYPVGDFGDPSLAIDGDTSTGWTAQVDPAIAPKMAAGLVIDLKAVQKLSALRLVTSTPGMTVQVFGADGSAAPASITDPAWVKLTPSKVEKARHVLLKLSDSTKAFRFVALWISGVPSASIGTTQAPGRVSVNEVELFPAK
jgi:hypothetical protein